LPPGLLNVVVGPSSEIGDLFSSHPIPRLISFTGSTAVGQHIGQSAATSKKLKKTALELGGNSPLVVLEDADLEQAVSAAIFGRFLHQGQICMATNRILVDAKLYDEFVERFTNHASKLKIGEPDDPETVIGPLITQKQLDHALEQIRIAKASGARLTTGGEPRGLILPPHVFANVSNDSELAQTEQFAPIIPIIKFSGDEEGLRLANETTEGLSSAVFSRNEQRALAFALKVEAGMTHINDVTVADYCNNPFGGEKNSGLGRFGGQWAIDEFTTDHWITVQNVPRPYPF
jgi:aldehyde dehydrogenase (NAD+)